MRWERVLGVDRPVREARAFVAEALSAWDVPGLIDSAELVASELTTNATVHGAHPLLLGIALLPDVLLIEVTDAALVLPAPRDPGETGGFGLTIVGSLARLSVHPRSHGKTVRAAIPRLPAGSNL